MKNPSFESLFYDLFEMEILSSKTQALDTPTQKLKEFS